MGSRQQSGKKNTGIKLRFYFMSLWLLFILIFNLKVLESNMGFSALIQQKAKETIEAIEELDILDDIEVLKDTLEDLSFA